MEKKIEELLGGSTYYRLKEEKVREIKSILPDKHIDLAVGLEIKEDFLRTVCINKGFSLKQFDNIYFLIGGKDEKKYLFDY